MSETIHCAECGALIEKALSIDGFGIRCGCLKKKYTLLKEQAAETQQRSLFTNGG